MLWCLNRANSSFQQIDIQKEAEEPISYVPKVAVAWSPEGTMAFVTKNVDADGILGLSEATYGLTQFRHFPGIR